MDYKKYFQENNFLKEDLSPNIKKHSLRILKNLGSILLNIFVLFLVLIIFFTIAISLPEKNSSIFFIIGLFFLTIAYFFYIFYFYGYIGEKWRKNPLEKWFRKHRLYDFLNYLENKKILNLKIIDKNKDIFENNFQGKNFKIDYIVEPYKGTRVLAGSPTSIFNNEDFEEYSHFFRLNFISKKSKGMKESIGFCGNSRKKFAEKSEGWRYKIDMSKSVFSLEENDFKIKDIMKKLEKIIEKYPNLKGYIDFKKNNSIEITLYDNFKNITSPGKHPYQDFLRKKDIAMSFKGFEELINLF